MIPPKFSPQKQGSLLVEALLSVVILSVSLTLIIEGMTTSLRSTVYISDYTTALLLLENKMFDLIQKGYVEANLQEEQEFPSPFERFKSRLITLPLDDQSGGSINQLKLSLDWTSGRRNNHVSIESYLFNIPDSNK